MKKITFTNTTVTKKPYVTINDMEYEVQDGTYTGGTDLDANTFNTMQNNIEQAINTVDNKTGNLSDLNTTNKDNLVFSINEVNPQKKILYTGNSFSSSITLNDNVTNYKRIEIHSKISDGFILPTVIIDDPNINQFTVPCIRWDSGVFACSAVYSISGNKLSMIDSIALYVNSAKSIEYSRHGEDNSRFIITEVVGYKKYKRRSYNEKVD